MPCMRLSVGVGIGPFRMSQTLARSGRRSRRPSARQTIAVESTKLVGQAALLPLAIGRVDQSEFDQAMGRFKSGEWCLSKALLAAMFGNRWFLTAASTCNQPSGK